MFSAIKQKLAKLAPGIFLLGYCIGTGSVTSMAKAGADYGMSLLWAVLASCVITFFLMHLYGKFTLVTGKTAIAAIKEHIHPGVAIFLIVALCINVSGSIMGVMGIIANVGHEWSRLFLPKGLPPIAFALFFSAFIYAIFWRGSMVFFEKILVTLVSIMALAFLLNFILFVPDLGEIAKGLIPNVPHTDSDKNPYLIIASMVGTTVFSGLFLMRGSLIKTANWTIADMNRQRKDAAISAAGMFIVSAAIMGTAAATLHEKGIALVHVADMISLLVPLAGVFAVYLFTIGVIAAGISSQFPNLILTSWLSNDFRNSNQNMKTPGHRLFVLLLLPLGLVVPILNARPVAVMIASQAFGATILPLTVACIFYLGNKKELMNHHAFSSTHNVLITGVFIFACLMSFLGIASLLEAF